MSQDYQKIAEALIAECPAEFERAWIDAKLDKDHAFLESFYEINGKTLQPDITANTTFIIGDTLLNIQKSMVFAEQEPWSKCTFTLFPDGQFKFDVKYDD